MLEKAKTSSDRDNIASRVRRLLRVDGDAVRRFFAGKHWAERGQALRAPRSCISRLTQCPWSARLAARWPTRFFIDYSQDTARDHLMVRRLKRLHAVDEIKRRYDQQSRSMGDVRSEPN